MDNVELSRRLTECRDGRETPMATVIKKKKKNTILGIKTFCTWVIAAFFEAWWTKKPLQSWNSSHDRTWYFINASNDCWNLSTGSFKAIPPVRRSYGYPRGPIFSRWNQRAVKNSWDLPPVLIWWDMDRYGGFQLAMGVAPQLVGLFQGKSQSKMDDL